MKTKKEKKSAHAIYIYLLYIYSKRLRKGERVEQRPYIITRAIYIYITYIYSMRAFSLSYSSLGFIMCSILCNILYIYITCVIICGLCFPLSFS